MAIKESTGQGNVSFYGINLKKGCLFQGSGKEKTEWEPGRAGLEGIPYRLAVDPDEYEGQKSLKANVYMHDPEGGPNQCVSFTIWTEASGASSQGLRLLGCLFAADTKKAIEIKPWFAEAGSKIGDTTFEKDFASVAVKQADQTGKMVSIKPDFLGQGDKLPETREEKIPGVAKAVLVKPGWDELMEGLVSKLVERLNNENPRNNQAQKGAPAGAEEIDPTDLAAAATAEGMRARA
jgi:hypothetical protein